MASFIEQATLLLHDKSSANINKINAALKKLNATARATKTAFKGIDLATNKFHTAAKAANEFARATSKIGRINVRPNVNFTALRSATATLKTLHAQAAKPLPMQILRIQRQYSRVNGGAITNQGLRVNYGNPHLVGRSIGRAFAAEARNAAFDMARNFGRQAFTTGVEAVTDLDSARTRAKMAFGPSDRGNFLRKLIEEESLKLSTGEFKNVNQAQLMDLAIEAASTTRDASTIKAMTRLSAENATILGVMRGDPSAGAEEARQLNKTLTLLNAINDPVRARQISDELLKQRSISGNDLNMGDIQRSLQQISPSIAKNLSAIAIADIANLREEGGRQLTANIRSGIRDMIRTSLSAKNKDKMYDFGLRDKGGDGYDSYNKRASNDPIRFAREVIKPLLEKAVPGIDTTDTALTVKALQEKGGFTQTGAQFWSDVLSMLDQIEINRRNRADADPSAGYKDKSLATEGQGVIASFQTMIGKLTEGGVPFMKAILDKVSDTMANATKGDPESIMLAAIAGTSGVVATLKALSYAASTAAAALLAIGGRTAAASAVTAGAVTAATAVNAGKRTLAARLTGLLGAYTAWEFLSDGQSIDRNSPEGLKIQKQEKDFQARRAAGDPTAKYVGEDFFNGIYETFNNPENGKKLGKAIVDIIGAATDPDVQSTFPGRPEGSFDPLQKYQNELNEADAQRRRMRQYRNERANRIDNAFPGKREDDVITAADEGASKFEQAFSLGSQTIQSATDAIPEKGAQAGTAISTAMVAAGGTVAAMISNAIANAASSININVRQDSKPGPDQGNARLNRGQL